MRRTEVAAGIWVIDYEAGIGKECYVPPKAKSQPPFDSVAPSEDTYTSEIGVDRPPITQSDSWKTVSHAAIDAAATEQKAFSSYEVEP